MSVVFPPQLRYLQSNKEKVQTKGHCRKQLTSTFYLKYGKRWDDEGETETTTTWYLEFNLEMEEGH